MRERFVGEAMIKIMEDSTVPACERVEAAKVLLSLGGWEPQGEEDEGYDHKVSRLVDRSRRLIVLLGIVLNQPHRFEVMTERGRISRICGEIEAAIKAMEDET